MSKNIVKFSFCQVNYITQFYNEIRKRPNRVFFYRTEPNRTGKIFLPNRTEPNRISVIEPNRTQTFHRVTNYSLFLLNSISAEDETIKSLYSVQGDHVTYTGALGACDYHGSRGHVIL
eukprot:sb/3476447/